MDWEAIGWPIAPLRFDDKCCDLPASHYYHEDLVPLEGHVLLLRII
jgi:hypothetical protein